MRLSGSVLAPQKAIISMRTAHTIVIDKRRQDGTKALAEGVRGRTRAVGGRKSTPVDSMSVVTEHRAGLAQIDPINSS